MRRTLGPAALMVCVAAACSPQYGSLRERAATEGTCRDAPAQRLVGRKATAQLAQQVLDASGARIFEWIAPNVIVTLAFNRYRVRVTYDESQTVTEIRCG